MFSVRSACGVGLSAILLWGCGGQSLREWWTEDLRRPRTDVAFYPDEGDFYEDESYGDDEAWSDEDRPPPLTSPTAPNLRRPQPLTSPPASSLPPRASPPRAETRPPPRAEARLAPPPAPPRMTPPPVEPSSSVTLHLRPIVPPVVSIAGMTEGEVRRTLGAPRAEIEKGPQKIWTYPGRGCSVEVIFFRDVTRNTYAALDHKTFAADGRTLTQHPCLQGVS